MDSMSKHACINRVKIQYDGYETVAVSADNGPFLLPILGDDRTISFSELPKDFENVLESELEFTVTLPRGAHSRAKNTRIKQAALDIGEEERGKSTLELFDLVIKELCCSHKSHEIEQIYDAHFDLLTVLGPVMLGLFVNSKKKPTPPLR
jgi:hypothetical protein